MGNDLSRSRIGAIVVLLILLLGQFAYGGRVLADTNTLLLKTEHQDLVLTIEIADTSAERSLGLMHREELPPLHGMLFDFNRATSVGMWMKNTVIPLDMLFINEQGEIRFIKQDAVPGSEVPIFSPEPVRAVLELAAGFVKDHGVKVGDQVRHPLFDGN